MVLTETSAYSRPLTGQGCFLGCVLLGADAEQQLLMVGLDDIGLKLHCQFKNPMPTVNRLLQVSWTADLTTLTQKAVIKEKQIQTVLDFVRSPSNYTRVFPERLIAANHRLRKCPATNNQTAFP